VLNFDEVLNIRDAWREASLMTTAKIWVATAVGPGPE
jgi:hypothetical protein